jgi:hypothetical protein
MTKRTTLPPVTAQVPLEIRPLIAAIAEIIETGEGVRGNALDRKLTLRDILDSGLATPRIRGRLDSGLVSTTPVPNLAIPPAPLALEAQGGFGGVIVLSWPVPETRYNNHGFTNIYRSEADNFSNALRIARDTGFMYVDRVRDDTTAASNPTAIKGYYYWITFTSSSGVEGPPSSPDGKYAAPLPDIDLLTAQLSGEINEELLALGLRDRIALIDGPATDPGTLNNRLQTVGLDISGLSSRADSIELEAQTQGNSLLGVRDRVAIAETGIDGLRIRADGADILIGDETAARISADDAMVTQQNLLSVQIRGSYDGSDLGLVTSGLLFQERQARVIQGDSLTQQMSLISAGVGEQFDSFKIYHFDGSSDAWTGSVAPVVAGGTISPANGSTPYVRSPSGLSITGEQYGQVRARVIRTGTPSWAGTLRWLVEGSSVWQSIAIPEPTYDINDIGLCTVTPDWTGTINQIEVQFSSAQSATDGYAIDWVAVGRPSPGASSAALAEESQARASADSSEATARQLLQSRLVGSADPSTASLGTLTSGLIFDERQARSTATGTLTTQVNTLTASVDTKDTQVRGLIQTESQARASEDLALTGQISVERARINSAQATIATESQTRADADSALTSQLTLERARIDQTQANIATESQTRATQDTALAQSVNTLQTTVNGNTSSVQTQQQAINGLSASYVLRVQAGNTLGGFGLYNDGNTLAFRILADKFSITPTSSGTGVSPFILDGGIVYMNTAMIKSASIEQGQLGPIGFGKIVDSVGNPVTTLQGKLRAEQIDVENLQVVNANIAGVIKSNSLAPNGQPEWSLDKNGGFVQHSGDASGRMEQRNNAIKIFGPAGQLLMQVGNLNA